MSDKPEVKVSAQEREVLVEASRGSVTPIRKTADYFRSLLKKKLIEGIGSNKYKATKIGLYVVHDTTSGSNGDEPSEADMPKAKAKPSLVKPKKDLKVADAEYSKKYKHFVAGSLHTEDGIRLGKIRCTQKGCDKTRAVHPGDIFQVKLCLDHKKAKTNAAFAKFRSNGKK